MSAKGSSSDNKLFVGLTILRELNKNGFFGVVFAGVDGNGKEVAVKRFKAGTETLEILAELQACMHINQRVPQGRQTNLMRFLECRDDPGQSSEFAEGVALVFEYCNGGNLRQLIDDRKQSQQQWSCQELAEFAVQLCDGLAALHSAGILHRDLAPRNILCSNSTSGEVTLKIGDFGTCKYVGQEMERKQAASKDSSIHQAPEADSDAFTALSDVWSLGIVVCEMMLRSTFSGVSTDKLPDERKRLRELLNPLSGNSTAFGADYSPLLPIVFRMLSDKVVDRCSAAQARDLFAALLPAKPTVTASSASTSDTEHKQSSAAPMDVSESTSSAISSVSSLGKRHLESAPGPLRVLPESLSQRAAQTWQAVKDTAGYFRADSLFPTSDKPNREYTTMLLGCALEAVDALGKVDDFPATSISSLGQDVFTKDMFVELLRRSIWAPVMDEEHAKLLFDLVAGALVDCFCASCSIAVLSAFCCSGVRPMLSLPDWYQAALWMGHPDLTSAQAIPVRRAIVAISQFVAINKDNSECVHSLFFASELLHRVPSFVGFSSRNHLESTTNKKQKFLRLNEGRLQVDYKGTHTYFHLNLVWTDLAKLDVDGGLMNEVLNLIPSCRRECSCDHVRVRERWNCDCIL